MNNEEKFFVWMGWLFAFILFVCFFGFVIYVGFGHSERAGWISALISSIFYFALTKNTMSKL